MTTTPIMDEAGMVLRVIGKITNINTEKAKEFELEDMKSRDGLTWLYTKLWRPLPPMKRAIMTRF